MTSLINARPIPVGTKFVAGGMGAAKIELGSSKSNWAVGLGSSHGRA